MIFFFVYQIFYRARLVTSRRTPVLRGTVWGNDGAYNIKIARQLGIPIIVIFPSEAHKNGYGPLP